MFKDIGKSILDCILSRIEMFILNRNKKEIKYIEQNKTEELKNKYINHQMSLFQERDNVLIKPKNDIVIKKGILERYAMYSRKDVHDVFAAESNFKAGCGIWGLHGIIRIPNTKDYIFFVTYGTKRGEHKFIEGIDENGIFSWQSQPRQNFKSPDIINFINHDEKINNIYLFKRNSIKESKYMYLGKLKYIEHDLNKENPVWFKWQILDWKNKDYTIESVNTDFNVIEYNLKQFDGIFSIDDIKREYNRISNEQIDELINNEKINGLLECGKKEYIFFDKLNITDKTIEELKKFINNIFERTGKKYLGYKVLYANISLLDEELFKSLKIENKPELLYSIIKYKFNNIYVYTDEFFGKENVPSINEILYDNLKNKKLITFGMVNDVYNELTLSNLSKNDFNEFINEIIDGYYVLDEEKTIISKDEFEISDENFVDVKIILNSLFENKNKLDLNTFKGYMLFPKIKYAWNRYLLKAVIDKYFNNVYRIEEEVIIKKEGAN